MAMPLETCVHIIMVKQNGPWFYIAGFVSRIRYPKWKNGSCRLGKVLMCMHVFMQAVLLT